MRKRERWYVRGEVLTPEVLSADPDKYGGLGLHMLASIRAGVVTIPLENGGYHVSIPLQKEIADRVLQDGGIDIESEAYWGNILSDKIRRLFAGTDEDIPLFKVGLHSL